MTAGLRTPHAGIPTAILFFIRLTFIESKCETLPTNETPRELIEHDMGLFSRSNSVASQGSTANLRHEHASSISRTVGAHQQSTYDHDMPANAKRPITKGLFGSRASSQCSTPSSSPPRNPASPGTGDLTAQGIPLRTSSKNATVASPSHSRSNSLVGQLWSRGRSLTSSSSKLSIASLASNSSAVTRRGSQSRKRSDSRASGTSVERMCNHIHM